jgi:two-component system, OmpR family, response regulator
LLVFRPPLSDTPTVLQAGDLEMDLLGRTVTPGGKAIDLQPREFQLLAFLMRNLDRVVTRTMLLEAVWDFHFDPKTNIVESHISRLRSKLSQYGGTELNGPQGVQTVIIDAQSGQVVSGHAGGEPD